MARSAPGGASISVTCSFPLILIVFQAYVSLKHEVDKVIVYERAGLLFIFNFHPTNSFTDYRVGVEEPGEYEIVLSSDEAKFAGFDNIATDAKHFTTPMDWNGRKNWLQVGPVAFWLLDSRANDLLVSRFTSLPELA
jgi:1,4-alpha-glucan branching enzyme